MIKPDRRIMSAILQAEEKLNMFSDGRDTMWYCHDEFRPMKEILAKSEGEAAYKYVQENPPARWMIKSDWTISISVRSVCSNYSYNNGNGYNYNNTGFPSNYPRNALMPCGYRQDLLEPPFMIPDVKTFAVHLSLVQFPELEVKPARPNKK